jgi:hypothetical protein
MRKLPLAVVILFFLFLSTRVFGITPIVRTINDGNLTMFFHNNGTFGYDPNATRGEVTGLYYPRDSYNGILSGGGIWIAGKRDGGWRITISGDSSEFVPGQIGNDGYPVDTSFRIYKITRGEDYQQNDDYRNWPVGLGAPADAFGRPLIQGSQALFTIFNDSDSAGHVFRGFAGTPPLGVQAKLSVHTWDNEFQLFDTMLSQVVFLDYTISNQFATPIDSCSVSLYADVDIGYSPTDRFGSNAELRCAYIYDESDEDSYYGPHPPVVGIVSLDDAITSANFYYPCSRQYPECIRVDTVTELINLVHGLRPNGSPHIDSVTLAPTLFPYGGDPSDTTGWVSRLSRDYRILLNTEPVEMERGVEHNVRAALIVARGTSNLDGVRQFLKTARMLRELSASDALSPRFKVSAENAVQVVGERLIGRDWGGRYLGGGADVASAFFHFSGIPDAPAPATLVLGGKSLQKMDRFVASGDSWKYAGTTTADYAMATVLAGHAARTVFLDLDNDGSPNGSDGKLEPLILTSLYSQSEGFGSGGADLASFAEHLLYAVELDQRIESTGPTTLNLDGLRMSAEFEEHPESITIAEPASEAPTERVIEIANATEFAQSISLKLNFPVEIGFQPAAFELGVGERRFVSIQSRRTYHEEDQLEILVLANGFKNEVMALPLQITPASLTVIGDADASGKFDLADALRMVRILYRDDPIVVPLRQIDSNCDSRFDLTDLVIFINSLYRQGRVPCNPTTN